MAKYLDATGVSTLWSKVKEYGATTASAAVKTITDTKGAKNGIASLDSNGYVPLSQLGNLDTTFAEVVTALPTSNIKKHLYLVKSSDTSQNLYSEYIYTGNTTATYDASKWEKLGEYKADVDLSAYVQKNQALHVISPSQIASKDYVDINLIYANSAQSYVRINSATPTITGVMSYTDKTKLDGIAANANNYSLPTASASTLGGIKVGSNLTINNGVLSGTADTHYTSKNVVSDSATGTTNKAVTTLTGGIIYLNHVENGSVTSSHIIKGTNATGVTSDSNGNITIDSKNTTYSDATTTAHGLMSKEDYDTFHNGMLINWGVQHDGDELDIVYYAISDTKHENPLTELALGGATSTYCGLMTSSDRIKLDSIATNATADSAITATELAKILV